MEKMNVLYYDCMLVLNVERSSLTVARHDNFAGHLVFDGSAFYAREQLTHCTWMNMFGMPIWLQPSHSIPRCACVAWSYYESNSRPSGGLLAANPTSGRVPCCTTEACRKGLCGPDNSQQLDDSSGLCRPATWWAWHLMKRCMWVIASAPMCRGGSTQGCLPPYLSPKPWHLPQLAVHSLHSRFAQDSVDMGV